MIRQWLARFSCRAPKMLLPRAGRSEARRKRCRTVLVVESLEDRTLMSATPTTAYLQTNLISDQPGVAAITDASLVNAWGLAIPPTGGNFWIADNHSGVAS